MKLKILPALLATLGMAAAGNASAVIVGGIDFGNPGTSHFETTTVAETFVNAVGQTLTGYGQVNTVNGDTTYCAGGAADPCRLFFTFTYTVQAIEAGQVAFNNGVITIYYDADGADINLLNQSSATNLANIQSNPVWADLVGHNFLSSECANPPLNTPITQLCATGSVLGSVINFEGAGLADVNTANALGIAAVEAFLDANNIFDGLGGFADVQLGTEGSNQRARLNPNDPGTGAGGSCVTNPQPGQWCIGGSASISGDTVLVPEPGTLALLGLGLAGLGFGARRKVAA